MTGLEALDRAVGRLGWGAADRHPLARLLVHLLDEVLLDGEAAVVLWRPPGQLAAVLSHAVDLKRAHGRPGPAQEDQFHKLLVLAVDVGGGDLIAGAVAPRARLDSQFGVVLGVDDRDVVLGGHLGAHQRPRRFGTRLTDDVNVEGNAAADLGRLDAALNVRPVDSRLQLAVLDSVDGRGVAGLALAALVDRDNSELDLGALDQADHLVLEGLVARGRVQDVHLDPVLLLGAAALALLDDVVGDGGAAVGLGRRPPDVSRRFVVVGYLGGAGLARLI